MSKLAKNVITYQKLSREEKDFIKKLFLEGLNPVEIARKINRSSSTSIRNYLLSQNLFYGKTKEYLSQFEEIPLTKREQEVYELLLKGFSREDIAKTLNISITTVCTHNNAIYGKKGCNSHVSILAKRIQELENYSQ